MSIINQISIRSVMNEDLSEVFPMIDKENWDWTLPEIEQLFTLNQEHSVVAVLSNKIIGLLFALKKGRFASWTHFIVKDEFRGQGIGTILMNHVFDDLKKAGVNIVDIIAVNKFVPLYKKAGFEVLEDLQLYSKNNTRSVSKSQNNGVEHCRIVNLKELEETGALLELEKQTGCNLDEFEGKSVFGTLSPVIGFYKESKLEGILYTHVSAYGVDIGPWVIQDINIEKVKMMLHFAENLFKQKVISLSVSSKNSIITNLVIAEGFDYVEKMTHMVLGGGLKSTYSKALVSVGKF